MNARRRFGTLLVLVLCTAITAVSSREALALISGGVGNAPLRDPGWPKGAEVIFNTTARVAWWEGPPLGGGQWHAECRGDAKVLSAVLANFAKLDVKSKRVVVHDGVGRSFWLNATKQPGKSEAAKIDWTFMVWVPASWKQLRRLPPEINPGEPEDAANGPPSQIDVYTGGNIKWDDVIVPRKLKIVDNRLEARGFALDDGIVLEGTVTDLATKKPLVNAKVRLERVEPKPNTYSYTSVAHTATDSAGRWVFKKAPAGWHRVVIEADGFVPRVAAYVQNDDQPRWGAHDAGLARPASVTGRVTDDAGQPLADVDVRIGVNYNSPLSLTFKTGADGRFRALQLPVGQATISVYKPGYCRPGLDRKITTPADGIELSMVKTDRVVITVDFTGKKRPAGYMVHIEPEGGQVVGKYGGSGDINAKNQMTFENVPPGRYVVRGRPNPGNDQQQTESVTVDLKGGKTVEVKLHAK
jgi:hypothetical protein